MTRKKHPSLKRRFDDSCARRYLDAEQRLHDLGVPRQSGSSENSGQNSSNSSINYVQDYKNKYEKYAISQLSRSDAKLGSEFLGAVCAAQAGGAKISISDTVGALWELAAAGKLENIVEQILESANQPPVQFPPFAEPWDPETEDPANAILRIYFHYIKERRMHLGVVCSTARGLYDEFLSWRRGKKNWIRAGVTPEQFYELVPLQKDYNSRLLAEMEQAKPTGTDEQKLSVSRAEQKRLYDVHYKREKRL